MGCRLCVSQPCELPFAVVMAVVGVARVYQCVGFGCIVLALCVGMPYKRCNAVVACMGCRLYAVGFVVFAS